MGRTELDVSQSQALILTYIQEQVAKAIGISASQLDTQQPLNRMGIDSLIAVKLRNQLRTDLAVDVSATKFMEDSSVASLAIEVSASLASVGQSHIPSRDEQKTTLNDDDWLKGEI
jgi:aryl carrier-like protein